MAATLARDVAEWMEAYRGLERFCNELGGKLSALDLVVKPGTKLLGLACDIPGRLDNEKLAEAIREIAAGEVSRLLPRILLDIGDFVVKEHAPGGRDIEYNMLSGTVTIHAHSAREFDIPPDRVEYVYPDPVEDYLETEEARIIVKAQGWRRAFERNRELKAYSWGVLVLYHPRELSVGKIKHYLDELDAMTREILENPRNFFKFKY